MDKCIKCGNPVRKRQYRSYLKKKYCMECWNKFQNSNKRKLKKWVKDNKDTIISLDNFPGLENRGYYIESNGTIWITKMMSRETLQGDPNVILPKPIQYHIPNDSPKAKYYNNLYYGDHGIIPIKDLVYYAFKGPFDLKKYAIVNKDQNLANNNIDNLLKIPRFLIEPMFYALKKGVIIASARSLDRLAAIIKETPEHVNNLYVTKSINYRGIYIVSQNDILRSYNEKIFS